jgi:hypothetical protein
LLAPFSSALAQSVNDAPAGYLDPRVHRVQIEALKSRQDIRPEEQRPLIAERDVSHVAGGIAMRDRARGFIHLRGVPRGSRVVRSLLVWNYSDQQPKGADTAPVLFDGNVVVGRKTADNTDPCWGRQGNHSYLADVTPFTNQTGGPNQEYEVIVPFTEKTSTAGENPWASGANGDVLFEGASLIVIYRNQNTRGALYVFAPKGDNMFTSSATYLLATPGYGQGLFTMVGADGQRGGGHDNGASNELTFFDGTQIAGPPVAASDWDGSDGLTLPQLWDTHTHIVKLSNPVSQVEYQAGTDCLVPVAFVLDQE